ncbi:aldo/keto reductase [Streptomyces sp. 4N509B]|uniref:aldo/keto reductase n=1 Tax=Streptomyces sp. 4N509B TaxID=3457413 RepID=UPI003FD2BEDB
MTPTATPSPTPTPTPTPAPTPHLATRRLGLTGPLVTSPGLGCMSLSGAYGPSDDDEGVRVVRAYLDAGGTLLDTGDFYGSGHNEWLIRRALSGRSREEVVLSVKFAALRGPDGSLGGYDARPAAVRNFLAYSLQRLGTDHVDVYRPARLDPAVPVEDTVGAIAELVDQGYVRHIGLSEVGAETIRRAAAVAPICDVQIEYSLLSRGIEDEILPVCRELGIGVTAYGVLGRGLIGGSGTLDGIRRVSPRFQGANHEHNSSLVAPLHELAAAKGVSVAQLAIAWVTARGEDVVPLVGSRNLEQVATLVDSGRVSLTPEEIARIEERIPRGAARGDRYPSHLMAELDSER